MYLNKVILIGNLTRDPEVRNLPSGVPVASLALATNRVWKDKNGMRQEDTQYHNVVVFGRQAETVSQYMKKGSSMMVEGRLQTRSWDSKEDGSKKYRTEIVADRIQFGPRAGGSAGGTAAGGQPEQAVASSEAIDYPDEINPDDIPF